MRWKQRHKRALATLRSPMALLWPRPAWHHTEWNGNLPRHCCTADASYKGTLRHAGSLRNFLNRYKAVFESEMFGQIVVGRLWISYGSEMSGFWQNMDHSLIMCNTPPVECSSHSLYKYDLSILVTATMY